MKTITFLCYSALLVPLMALAQTGNYPGRITYPSVMVLETEQLNAQFDDVIIVDVRSNYEYDTLHINNAVNIPLNDAGFTREVEALQAGSRPIVFYCNGHSCYKSYKACTQASNAGINNVYAYDSGVFDWARAYPDRATLLGKTPVSTSRLISKADLGKKLLTPGEFSARISNKAVILDIRDAKQRGLVELFPYRQQNISLDDTKKLDRFLNGIKSSGKTLLVYDEAGKQVRWFQYYLVEKGISDYYFMNGGVKQFFKDLAS
jgi:rhodanese-related sulfurtransferase